MRSLLAIPRTLLTLVVGVVVTIIAGTAVLAISSRKPDSRMVEPLIRWWARSWMAAAGIRMSVTGLEHVELGSQVVIANHLSNFDVMVALASIPLPIRFLTKQELFKIPLFAQAMRAVGMVEVDRAARSAAIESVNRQAAEVVERGHSLIIFPEGTRSRDGELKQFKKGAFTMAVAGAMPVLPVTIHGTREVWPPESLMIHGGPVRMVIDRPIPTSGLGRQEVDGLRERVREIIAGRLAEINSPVAQS